MNYYKLLNGADIFAVGTSNDLRTFQKKHTVIMACDESCAQYIQIKDRFYRDTWMLPPTTDTVQYEDVTIVEITEEEYTPLFNAFKTETEIVIPDTPVIQEEKVEDPTLDYIKEMKIAQLSKDCNQKIESGFSCSFSNGEELHFSLEMTDQLMIQALYSKAMSGEKTLPWHSDNQLCRFFTDKEIVTLYNKMADIITYETTYFNSLKHYVLALETAQEVDAVEYGQDIPEGYRSEVLMYLLSQNRDDA